MLKIAVSDSLIGGFEYGTEDGLANVVALYGEWNFGAGSLLIGQAEVPIYQGISGQVYDDDRALDGIGEFNPGERAMIRLAFGGFQVAAVETDAQVSTAAGLDDSLSEVKIPTLHARYDFAADAFDAAVGGAVSRFDYNDESVTAYVAVASIGVTVNRFRLAAQGWFGQNVANLATVDTRGDGEDGFAIYEGGAIHDVDAWGIALVAQVVFNETLSMEAGYGHADQIPGLVHRGHIQIRTLGLRGARRGNRIRRDELPGHCLAHCFGGDAPNVLNGPRRSVHGVEGHRPRQRRALAISIDSK